MTTPEFIGWGMVAAAGVAGSALCSGLETGVYCLNRVKLYARAQRTPAEYAARLLKQEVDHPERLLAANLIANAAFAYLGAAGITRILDGLGYSDAATILINLLVLAPVFFVFVESLPKEVFRAEADRLTYAFAPSITVTRLVLTGFGVLPLIRLCAEGAARLIGGEGGAGLAQTSRERLAAMLKETQEHGVLSASQAALVDRALLFYRLKVRDEMVPWESVAAVWIDSDRSVILATIARAPHTWLPVMEARTGRVAGVLSAADVPGRPETPVPRLVLEPARLAPDTPIREAVLRLREAAAPVGIVEQLGKPLGLVASKDLIEPLTGELLDW